MISLLITLMFVCLVFGIIIYVARSIMPLAEPFKSWFLIVVCIIFILVLLGFVTGYFPPIEMPAFRR